MSRALGIVFEAELAPKKNTRLQGSSRSRGFASAISRTVVKPASARPSTTSREKLWKGGHWLSFLNSMLRSLNSLGFCSSAMEKLQESLESRLTVFSPVSKLHARGSPTCLTTSTNLLAEFAGSAQGLAEEEIVQRSHQREQRIKRLWQLTALPSLNLCLAASQRHWRAFIIDAGSCAVS